MTRVPGLDRAILRLAVPALATLPDDPLVSMVDTAFVGRVGTEELAALAVDVAIFGVAFFLFNFLAYGTTPLVAQAIGRGDRRAASAVVVQGLALAALLGVCVLVVLQVAALPLLRVMGAGPGFEAQAEAYLRVRAFAVPAVLVITVGHGAFRGYQDTATPLWVTLGVNVLNLVADPLLIFGLGWGIVGAAVATVASQWLGAVWFLYLLLMRRRRTLGIELARPDLAALPSFLRIGWQLVVRTAALLVVYTLAVAVAARIGTVQVAAHQIAAQVWLFLALTVDALAVAAQALVGRYLGAGDSDAVTKAARALTWLGGLTGLVLGVGVWLGRDGLARLFTTDPDVAAIAVALLGYVALLQPVSGLVFVWDGVFIGATEFRFLAVTTVAASAGASLLLLAIPFTGWGITAVWAAISVMMVTRAVLVGSGYFRLVRKGRA